MLERTLSRLAATRLSTPGHDATQMWCVVLLVAGCASASLVFSCATPFAAFAVLAAAALPLRSALAAIVAVWLVNQAIGFGLLGYPHTLNTAAWGLAIGAAAAVATVVAAVMFRRLAAIGRFAAYPLALLASFAGYELGLLAVTPVLGGAGAFTLEIVGRIAFLNAVWLAGLVVALEAGRLLDGVARRQALR